MTDRPRVRFAPSPTGYLHVGGARTALFNWLFARQSGGTMILRIEDTDRARSTDEHTQVILDGLAWLGVTIDEGPWFQAEGVERHKSEAEGLLAAGKAYRCFCTPETLEAQRKEAAARKQPFRYDRRCHKLTEQDIAARIEAGDPFAIRFLMPDETIAWDDMVHGPTSFQGADLDDLIILRSNGTPIYNLAVVSDDHDMAISHVIRGDDHLSNTPKQIALYRALGYEVPLFAHVPMILGSDGKKLSKRHGATAVGDYQAEGILPPAMRNFLALLGWSPGEDREILEESELIRLFRLEDIQKKPAVFDTVKLEWMNGQYLSALPAESLRAPVTKALAALGVTAGRADLDALIDAVKTRSRTVTHLAEQIAVRLDAGRIVPDAKASALVAKLGPAYHDNLGLVLAALEPIDASAWHAERRVEEMRALAQARDIKLGDIMQPVRVALTGTTVSEPVDLLLTVVGRDESLDRLRSAARPG
jgi:glutamyl-tRNA synthetase